MSVIHDMNIFKQFGKLNRREFHVYGNSGQATCLSLFHTSSNPSVEVPSKEQEVAIALGSNVGDRLHNFYQALQLMKKSGVHITRHSCLYETEPVHVTDQPLFLNSVVRGITNLGPHDLLRLLKTIEKSMGRADGIRYGPRPIDLDILFYGKNKIYSESLTVPHERMWERPFVMAPLVDVLGTDMDNSLVASWHSLSRHSGGLFGLWEKLGGETSVGKQGIKRVLPIKGHLWDWSQKTSVMGILNLTPDSFSDGGKFMSVDAAVAHARLMILGGANIIDIGAQSTRPMAPRISPQEELDRLIPTLEAVLAIPEMEGRFLSVDTFHSEVALEAVQRGAHLVNDVSGGQLDAGMHGVVADLRVPYIAMHMRGDPTTMQEHKNLRYSNVCEEIGLELWLRAREAELAGIPAWSIIIDPGIGFSKSAKQNLQVLTGIPIIRGEIAKKCLAVSHAPLLIGPSRKKFLGEICSRFDVTDRDPATLAAVTAGILGGANIVRVHNVRDNLDAVKLCDAMMEQKRQVSNLCSKASVTCQ